MKIEDALSSKKSYAQGSKTPDKLIKKAKDAYNSLVGDLKHYIFVQNQTFPVALMPGESGSMVSNILLLQNVLMSLPESTLPPPMSLPTS